MYAGAEPAPLRKILTLDEINIPVLGIYGDNDTNSANTAVARKAAFDNGAGAGLSYTQMALTCGTAIGSDCHKLVGLKGTSTSPLELAVSDWIASL